MGNLNIASLGHDTIQAHTAGYVSVLHFTAFSPRFEHHLAVNE